jgi:hypothetical protein
MKNYIFNGDKYAFIEALDKKWEGSLPIHYLSRLVEIIYGKPGLIDPLALKVIAENIGRISKQLFEQTALIF